MIFGSNGKQIDGYGANLVSAPLPDMGWKALYDNLRVNSAVHDETYGSLCSETGCHFHDGQVGDTCAVARTSHTHLHS